MSKKKSEIRDELRMLLLKGADLVDAVDTVEGATKKDAERTIMEMDATKAPTRGRYLAMIMNLLWRTSEAGMMHIEEKLLRLLDQVEGYSTIRGQSAWDGGEILTKQDAIEYLRCAHADHQSGFIDSAGLRSRIQVARSCMEMGLEEELGPDSDHIDPDQVIQMDNSQATEMLLGFTSYDRKNPN